MKKESLVICALAMLVGIASAQQVSTKTNASASNNTSVAASQHGANVSSNTNGSASSQTSVSEPKSQKSAEHRQPKHESKKEHGRQPGSANASSALAAGTTVNAVLSKPLDSRKCKPGDPVVATASQDVKADGKVVVKKGSKLVGHVTEAKAKGYGEATSALGIVFDRAITKGGQEVEMNSVVQAIAAAQTNASMMDDDMGAMGSGNMASAGGARAGSGLLGGVGSTASGATGAAANLGGNATGAVNSTLHSTAGAGNGLSGALNSSSSGVVGMKNLSLASNAANATQGSIITSSGKSVHLDSGTQMVLRVVKQ